MEGAIEKPKQLVQTIPDSYHLNQFNNPWNPDTYYYTLGPELWTDLQGQIDTFIAGAGSCGTFTGIARFFKEKDESIKTVVDRKSTRLNSSHVSRSYAVFCLKEKKNERKSA